MTTDDYEDQGGFREELAHGREIGMRLVTLKEAILARPHREPEIDALRSLESALDALQIEIGRTRYG